MGGGTPWESHRRYERLRTETANPGHAGAHASGASWSGWGCPSGAARGAGPGAGAAGVAYLALSKVADAVFSTAPNPTPTARPSETDTRRACGVRDRLPLMLTAVTGSSGAPGPQKSTRGEPKPGQRPKAWAESSSPLVCVGPGGQERFTF